jgi:hypothetical protein
MGFADGPTLQDADAAESRGQLWGSGQQFDDRFVSDQSNPR